MKGIPDVELHISAVTVMEARKGFARQRRRAATAAGRAQIAGYETDFDELLRAFGDRVLAVDMAVADRWGELLGQREVHVMDVAVAATAFVHGLVVATRNVEHFRGRRVRVIDPFRAKAVILEM